MSQGKKILIFATSLCFLGFLAFTTSNPRLPNGQTEPPAIHYLTQSRSPHWRTVEKHHLEKEPECVACGSTEGLNVHHIIPFHLRPDLELDDSNLITLCRDHHFKLGHLGNWKNYNPHVREDAERERGLR